MEQVVNKEDDQAERNIWLHKMLSVNLQRYMLKHRKLHSLDEDEMYGDDEIKRKRVIQ